MSLSSQSSVNKLTIRVLSVYIAQSRPFTASSQWRTHVTREHSHHNHHHQQQQQSVESTHTLYSTLLLSQTTGVGITAMLMHVAISNFEKFDTDAWCVVCVSAYARVWTDCGQISTTLYGLINSTSPGTNRLRYILSTPATETCFQKYHQMYTRKAWLR